MNITRSYWTVSELVTGLVDALDPVAPANPDAVVDHPLAQRLNADRQAVDLG
jgi:hypothetical protein